MFDRGVVDAELIEDAEQFIGACRLGSARKLFTNLICHGQGASNSYKPQL